MTDDKATSDTERNPDPQQHMVKPGSKGQPNPAPGDDSNTSPMEDDTDDGDERAVNPANL